MNTSYLGAEWYIDELKTKANDAPGDDLLDGVVIEAHGCNIGSAMAVLALVRTCHHRVVMVETAEKV